MVLLLPWQLHVLSRPAPPCTCFAQGCASARDLLVRVEGLWAAGYGCCFKRVWVRLPGAFGSNMGVWATPARDLSWGLQASSGHKEHFGMRGCLISPQPGETAGSEAGACTP